MAKTLEELEQLKNEYQSFKTKLDALTEEEIEQIVGGFDFTFPDGTDRKYNPSFYKNDVKTPEDFTSKLK